MKTSFTRNTLELTTILIFIFFFSFIFNFFWEALHAVYLYQRHDFDAANYVPMLIYVSSVDSLIVLGLYLGMGVMWLDLFWLKLFRKIQILVFYRSWSCGSCNNRICIRFLLSQMEVY
jgi:hypothetical protein